MKEIYERPYNNEEKEILKDFKYSYWNHFENFILKWVGVTLLLLCPFFLYEKFISKVSSETQLTISIPLQITSILIVLYIMKRMGQIGWNKKVDSEIKNGKAEVLKIKTDKIIKRDETYDLGSGFYVKISENETLYLQGQYFDELEYEKKFPNTEFEISKTSLILGTILEYKSYGKHLEPEKELKAFTSEQFEKEEIHYDGDLLTIPIEQIK